MANMTMSMAHTAGIFADMTVDGPEIGTLVMVVDRAKNLPNRKTMGKQNPYCAARLGKEAKKTDTDKRGGQTPKWDQELRFTVHESPDYYQLKVSIFNDDKKTELIGETWVDLKSVIVPGGGQSDVWHGLLCKGKYAGEVRMELTYYDVRPKDETVVEKRREATKIETRDSNASRGQPEPLNTSARGLSGPRQPKPLKRRPLPSDPTAARPMLQESTSAPSPMAQTQQLADMDQFKPLPLQPKRPSQPTQYPFSPDDYGVSPAPSEPDPHDWADRYTESPVQSTPPPPPPQTLPRHDSAPAVTTSGEVRYSHPSLQNRQPQRQYTLPQPAHTPPSVRPSSGVESHDAYGRGSVSPTRQDGYRDSPLRNSTSHTDLDPRFGAMQPTVEDEADDGGTPPPPPPVHRHTYDNQVMAPRARREPSREVVAETPPPLNVHHQPLPGTRSWPQPEYTAYSDDYAPLMRPNPPSQPSPAYNQRPRAYSGDAMQSPTKTGMPPSLVAGYDPAIADEESDRMIHEGIEERRNSNVSAHSPMHYHHDSYSLPPQQTQSDYPGYDERPRRMSRSPGPSPRTMQPTMPQRDPYARHDPYAVEEPIYPSLDERPRRHSPAPPMPSPIQDPPHDPYGHPADMGYQRSPTQERPFHRSPGPMQRAASPAPTAYSSVRRRSVSPAPPPSRHSGDERGMSQTPFGPDSYDILNPPKASSIILPAPTYETPEEQAEAARQKEVQKLRAVGPIIGNDGREIDPSDHLPCDTWAPEPERKSRKPEVVIRFRNAPANMQPRMASTPPRNPNVRPNSTYSYSQPTTPDAALPAPRGTVRNRLQKPNTRPISVHFGSPAHAHSSPAIPTSMHNTPSPRGGYQHQTRNSVSELPLREHTNYGGGSPSIRSGVSSYAGSVYGGSENSYGTRPRSSYGGNGNISPGGGGGGHSPGGSFGGGNYGRGGSAPPIPAKIPISAGSQNYRPSGYDALSDELSRIDIGSGAAGGGSARGRRVRMDPSPMYM